MKTNYFVLLLPLCILLSGCGPYHYVSFKDLTKVELGMNKQQITHILGETYLLNYKGMDSDNNFIEEITYEVLSTRDKIHFRLINDQLIEVRRELPPQTVTVTTTTQTPVVTGE